MEIDVKQSTQRSKRRKRAQRMQAERGKEVVRGGEVDSGEEDYGSLKRDKSVRPPVRRKRNKDISPILEEDIIDGFAILAFKTYEDLEFAIKIASKRNEKRLSSIIELTKLMADENLSDIISKSQKSNSTTESKPRDGEPDQKGKISNYINQNAYCQDAGTSDDSGRASERLTTSSVAQRDAESSRDRLSDASSRCSSGKGYICDSEGDDDKVSDAGSGFSNTHPFTATTSKSSKSNSTPPPTVVDNNVSTNNVECKTDVDQKVATTDLPPPALPPSSAITTAPLSDKQNQNVQVQVPSRTDEKCSSGDKNTQSTSLIPPSPVVGGITVKTENISSDVNNVEAVVDSKNALNEITKETHQTNSTEKRENDGPFGVPIKVVKHDPVTDPATANSFLYRSPYAQTPPGFPPYPYPVPPLDSKDAPPIPTLNNKPLIPSGSKEKLDKISSVTHPVVAPVKERDNFSDIDSLSVSSVTSSNTAVVQSIPSSKVSSISFPRPMPTNAWPLSTTTTTTSTSSTPEVPKPSISGAKSTPPPTTATTSSSTFATPLPPPTTTAPLSFSAESLFSTKPKDQTDLLRRELDNRFLDRAGLSTSSSTSNPPYLRQELHHHQHQHTHLHQHHQQIIPAVNPAAQNTIFSAPLFKDIPKIGGVDSPFYRTGISVPMYTTYPPTILHPTMGAATTQFIPQNSLSTFIPKKTGRWNAMHVRIAWEIYSHQTKQNPEKTNPLKATEVLRNPSHLHSPASAGGLLRTHEMMPGYPAHLMGGRNIFDSTMSPQFLSSSSHLGMSPFSRYSAPFPPSPFATMPGFGRDSALGAPFTGLHDPWRSLQRPYLPSPAPPNWGMKPDVSNIEISKREAEERERQLREREERERLRREREEKERQRERDREREEKLKKEAERERKEKEKREQERREMERERMLQQQRMNEMKPNVHNSVMSHDRSPLRNGCEPDMRIKEESRKDEDVMRSDPSRYTSSSNPMMGTPSHAYLSSRHPQHVLGVSPSHLSRSILPPHPGSSLSHFPPPPPPSVWSGVDPYRDPYRLDPMSSMRYNPLMEAMRAEEERAKAMYALHYRPKDPASFPMMHHRMPTGGPPPPSMNSMKPNGPSHIPPVNSDALKKDDSSQNR